jgi:ATP-dependent helicase HrpA
MSTPSAPPVPSVAELRERLNSLTLRDAARLGRRLEGQRRKRPGGLTDIAQQIERAERIVTARTAAVPTIVYPALPVSERREDIAAAIRDHQVVVVAGETGSGKTTQLPKICLELGRGIRGTIGHTQPRRLAARTVAQRIADELGSPLGDVVGYTVRFTDQVSDRTLVRLMTDGILLAEIQRDRRLLRYDTLIIDEAHERSLNIDFLLGYLTELLPQRPDLKVIITSATIDPERFAQHFAQRGSPVPIVEVSGRTYPVEVRYRPLEADPSDRADAEAAPDSADDPDHDIVRRIATRDQVEGITDAVGELMAEGPGDILVFLSGEREIRDTAEALRGLELPNTEVLPLYARLSTAEQQRVFGAHTGRRIVLATNVAETSLTVPGIHYVIDPGTARISRYSHRTKVQRLPIESISQASAGQRAGRCGRTADGICIRLYSERDFAGRPEFTEPEILRTNLASVILQMTALGLGDLERFPFVEPPDRRSVRDGIALLHELGALDEDRLTEVGRQLAQLPVDPRLGRMIVQAKEEGCVGDLLVIAAALSIPDPRERPADQQARAQQLHARFADEHSDFIGYLNLWRYLRDERAQRSGNQFRRLCRDEFLHYLRIREWQDLVGQLRTIAASLGIREDTTDSAETPAAKSAETQAAANTAAAKSADAVAAVNTAAQNTAANAAIHRAVLAGLLSHVGLRTGEGREFAGARNSRFVIAPGSALARRPPRWVVAAELVETSALYARVAARVEPETIEQLAGHVVARSYSEPHWDRRRGAAMAYERVTLYGLPLVTRRRIDYGRIEPEVARELFIRGALVEGEWDTRHHFFRDNQQLVESLSELEERARRRDLLVGDDDLFAFYDARIPSDVVSVRHFDAWWKKARHRTPELLTLTRADLLRDGEDAVEALPDDWTDGDLTLPLSYRFEPGASDDGVTVHVPVEVLARLGGDEFGWQVPALREELVTALIRALPKELRRRFVPAPDTARAVLSGLAGTDEPLLPAVQRELHRLSGVLVPLNAFDLSRVPAHLRVTFAVEDDRGTVVARGKDLSALQESLATPIRAAVAAATDEGLRRDGLRTWPDDLDVLPRTVEQTRSGHTVRGFPSLVDLDGAVGIRVLATEAEQRAAMPVGTRRLLRTAVASPIRAVPLSTRARLLGLAGILDDCADAAVDALVAENGGPAWDAVAFGQLRQQVAAGLPDRTRTVAAAAERVLAATQDVRAQLPSDPSPAQRPAILDLRAQLAELTPEGFATRAGAGRLLDLARYVRAIGVRLEKLAREVDVDAARMARVHEVQHAYQQLVAALPASRTAAADVQDIRWLIEELRVSLFAQQLGTSRPVSEQRIYRAIDAVSP